MIVDADLCSQRHVVADRQAAREPDLGREQAIPADRHIVADLDLIVDFGALPDHGVAQRSAIDGGAGADFHIVLDQHAAGLGHFHMALGAEEDEAIAVLADRAAGVDEHVIADQRTLDGRTGADIAVPADLDPGTNDSAGADHGATADLDIRADHGEGIDNDVVFQPRRGVDDGRRRNAGIADPGLRAQGIAVPLPGDPDEGTERLRHP